MHLVGGILGSILLGLFADASVNAAGKDGVFFGGGWGLFGEQVLAVAVVLAFSFVVSGCIGLVLEGGACPGASASPKKKRTPASTSRSTPKPATRSSAPEQEDDEMKLIVAIIKPFKLDEVKEALHEPRRAGPDRHRGAGLRPPSAVTPRCTEAPSTRSTSCRR